MRFNLRKAVGFAAIPLLGGALAVGATALPASAQTYLDTALQAFNVTQPTTTAGAVVNGVVSGTGRGSTLTFTAPAGESFSSVNFAKGTTDALMTQTPSSIVLTSGHTATGVGILTFTIGSTTAGVTCTAAETVMISEVRGTMGESATPTSVPNERVTVSHSNNSTTGAVTFTGTVRRASCTVTFSESKLPTGLTSGNPLLPGSAVPGTYTGVVYTATDPLGSTFSGMFDLKVIGHQVVTPTSEVSSFANYSHSCLTNRNGTLAAYNPLQLFTCGYAGGASQQLRLVAVTGQTATWELQFKTSSGSWCVTQSAFNASPLVLGVCNTGTPGMRRQFITLISGAGNCHCGVYYRFPYTGRVMDDWAYDTSNGATVGTYGLNGGRNQGWSLP